MPQLVNLLPLVGIALVFWLLIIRPAQRRQKEARRLQAELSVGDEVMLASGLFGVLRELRDDRAMVEIAPGVQVSVTRMAVTTRVTPVDGPDGLDDTDEPDSLDNPDVDGEQGGDPSRPEDR